MSRHRLTLPVSVVVLSLVLISMVLTEPSGTPFAAPLLQCEAGQPGYPDPCVTQTAAATAATSTMTSTSTATGVSATATATSATATATATGSAVSATTTRTLVATVPSKPTTPPESETAVPQATPSDGAIACVPGEVVIVQGRAPRSTPLLIYLDKRAVGGGTSDGNGFFRLRMVVGNERAGIYPLQVRIRGTQRVVHKGTCIVPYFTPTPTPLRRQP